MVDVLCGQEMTNPERALLEAIRFLEDLASVLNDALRFLEHEKPKLAKSLFAFQHVGLFPGDDAYGCLEFECSTGNERFCVWTDRSGRPIEVEYPA